ncbi:WD40 repeat domain-containing protein [Streptomyces sp. MB09-01]|uniref:WD40 repeat domain-containing protein n=1 Tax=Streptomyces sp. MB09-01 TaxID=3028666 RepID=UPI0029AFCE2D|nr:WD40 repeat domain-containing protein [Streptomyces sp. MB09-01]MDX3539848.1 WD40 repeat domain-containing protein [Streptomyces sp. MB09-01]
MDSDSGFEEELSRLAGDLRQLRIERGNPSYRKLETRAAKSRTGLRLPVATQSDAFRGKRLLGLDTLMALVRILYAYDEYGRETTVPPHNSPRLEPWRSRWRDLAALQPSTPGRGRDAAPPAASQAADAPTDAKADATADTKAGARAGAIAAYRAGARAAAARRAEAARVPPPPILPLPSRAEESGFFPARLVTSPANHPLGAVFSPDGRFLATRGEGVVQLRDAVHGRPVGEIDAGVRSVSTMAFSPDGRLLATGADDCTARLWDLAAHAAAGPALLGHEEPITVVAFSPDGSVLVTAADDESVRRWDTATGEPAGPPLIGHFGEVGALAFLPDGGLLAALRGKHVIRIWDLTAGASVGEPLIGHRGAVHGMAFSPDGRVLATVGADGARLWDTATGAAVAGPLGGPDRFTRGVAFSQDGRLLATGCDDGIVRLWDPATGAPDGTPLTGDGRPVHSVAFAPNGRVLAACGESGTMVIHHLDPDVASRAPSPLGSRALTAALRQGHAVPLPAASSKAGTPLRRLAFSPDGGRLLVRTADRTVLTWDPVTRNLLPEVLLLPADSPWGLEFPVEGGPAGLWTPDLTLSTPLIRPVSLKEGVAFAPDGRWAAMVNGTGRILFWDADAGLGATARVPDGVSDLYALAVSPDGRTMAGAFDEKVALWDRTARDASGLELGAHWTSIRTLAFSPDGRLLATGDIGGNTRLWNLPAGPSRSLKLSGHTGQVYDLAFSPDSRLLASAGADGTVQLWNTHAGESVGSLPLTGHTGAVRGVAFSPDGSLIASAGEDGTLRFWVLPGPHEPTARPR